VKVVLAGFQAVSILRGGPSTQIRATADHLRTLGVDVAMFDPWSPFSATSADVVHLFSAGIGTYHLAREIHALGMPLVVSPITSSRHTPAFVHAGLLATRILQRLGPGTWSDYGLMADICGWAARVLPNTGAEARIVEKGLGVSARKIKVVPNGVDERFDTGDPAPFRKKYGVENFILNVGHIGHPRKNVLSLIRALATIDRPSVIIGRIISSEYGDACVREAARHRQILLIDGLEHDSSMLASAYAACDVFALPSQFETPGIAALEAGLAGAKIVITPRGGTKEYFENLAVYVDPESVDSIRSGILKALSHPKDERLKSRIKERYLWGRVAALTADVYREVLRESTAGR
jgi:glycosyltransferase involved in cell wall biosynthesis